MNELTLKTRDLWCLHSEDCSLLDINFQTCFRARDWDTDLPWLCPWILRQGSNLSERREIQCISMYFMHESSVLVYLSFAKSGRNAHIFSSSHGSHVHEHICLASHLPSLYLSLSIQKEPSKIDSCASSSSLIVSKKRAHKSFMRWGASGMVICRWNSQ